MLMKLLGVIWKRMPRGMRGRVARSVQVKFTVSAAAVVTNEEGQVLLLNHILRPDSGWGIPGGFIDRGEQPEETLRREIREETGLELEDVRMYRVRTLGRHIEVIFTARGVGTPKVMSREITELAWFDVDKMPAEMSVDQQFLVKNALAVPTH